MFGLRKTLSNLFSRSKIDDEWFNDLEETLLLGDVGVPATNALMTDLKRQTRSDKADSADQLKAILATLIENLLRSEEHTSELQSH